MEITFGENFNDLDLLYKNNTKSYREIINLSGSEIERIFKYLFKNFHKTLKNLLNDKRKTVRLAAQEALALRE